MANVPAGLNCNRQKNIHSPLDAIKNRRYYVCAGLNCKHQKSFHSPT